MHRALAHNNVESRKLLIWPRFWEIDMYIYIYHACWRFTSFTRLTFGRFNGNEDSIFKIPILRLHVKSTR